MNIDRVITRWKSYFHGLIKNHTKTIFSLGVWVCSFGLSCMLFSSPVFGNPEGGEVVAGSASISSPDSSTVHIQQTTEKAVIDWRTFNIAPNEKTQFQQPGTNSITLNRVDPNQGASSIYGQISANGHVWLVNPAGIFIGSTARIDVAGLLATTAYIKTEDFMRGYYHFTQLPGWHGAIINEGHIIAAQHGLIALFAPFVDNKGTIEANVGQVVLASGNTFTINFSGDGLIHFSIDE